MIFGLQVAKVVFYKIVNEVKNEEKNHLFLRYFYNFLNRIIQFYFVIIITFVQISDEKTQKETEFSSKLFYYNTRYILKYLVDLVVSI